MLSKFISVGAKVELQAVNRSNEEEYERKTYVSSVNGILSEDKLEITMPMEKTKLVLLSVDEEYDVVFYGESGLFQCFARITDRYKSQNIYLLVLELTSTLRKYQRREFYRYSCALNMCSRPLEEEEVLALESGSYFDNLSTLPLKESLIVDISGGGLRFISTQKYEPGTFLYINYHLLKKDEPRKFEVVGKVLSAREVENRPGNWEHRVQYFNMDFETREEIIRYIFEEERKNLKRGKRGK